MKSSFCQGMTVAEGSSIDWGIAMKEGIHPKYELSKVTSFANVFETKSTSRTQH